MANIGRQIYHLYTSGGKTRQILNKIHLKIKYTMEIEQDNQFPFLDITVMKKGYRNLRPPIYNNRNPHKPLPECQFTPPYTPTLVSC